MNKVLRTRTRVAREMTDPLPEFVSLVSRGANQTPFKTLKADQPDTTNEGATIVSKAAIQSYTFPKASFTLAKAAKALEDAGYDDVSLIKTEDTYVATVKAEADFAEGTVFKTVKTEDGYDVVMAEIKEDEPEAVVTQKQDTAVLSVGGLSVSEIVKKYDDYEAWFSNHTTLAAVMADGADGLPPAMWIVTEAFRTAVKNCLLNKDIDGVRAAAEELGAYVVKLAEVFSAATFGDTAEVVQKFMDDEPEVAKKSEAAIDLSVVTDALSKKMDEVLGAITAANAECQVTIKSAMDSAVSDIGKHRLQVSKADDKPVPAAAEPAKKSDENEERERSKKTDEALFRNELGIR